MRPASSGCCLSEQEINLDPGCSVFSSPPEWISFAYLCQGDNLNICPSGICRLPQAAWLHRNAQCQLPQWPWDGRDHEPDARSGQRGAIWEHPTRQTGPRADGCSALRPRDGHQHGWHASSGGLRHVSSSGHEQEGRGPLDAPRTHKLHTQQVGARSCSGVAVIQARAVVSRVLTHMTVKNGWCFPRVRQSAVTLFLCECATIRGRKNPALVYKRKVKREESRRCSLTLNSVFILQACQPAQPTERHWWAGIAGL